MTLVIGKQFDCRLPIADCRSGRNRRLRRQSKIANRKSEIKGFTLVEMLVVCAIIAAVLGIGIALLSSAAHSHSLAAAALQVEAVLRLSRSSAITQGNPSHAAIDPEANSITAVALRTMAAWHFEDELGTGAFARHAALVGVRLVPGKFGMAALIPSSATIDCGSLRSFTRKQGFLVHFYLMPQDYARSRASLLDWKNVASISITEANGIEGVLLSTNSDEMASSVAPPQSLPPEVWSQVTLRYDMENLSLDINGHEVAATPAPGFEFPENSHLLIGRDSARIEFAIDELRILAIVPGESYVLPKGTRFGNAPPRIFFDAHGRLDSRYHQGNVAIEMTSGNSKETILINVMGLMEHERIGQ